MPTAAIWADRRVTVAAVLGIVALLMAMLAPAVARADVDAEAAFVAAANRERAEVGLPSLAVADDLVAVARAHGATMADGEDLHHNPALTSDVADWQRVGENVGRGPDVDVIHTAFMASPAHRANILEPGWTEIGVGVEVRDGRIWVTQVFRLPAAEPAAEAAPAPETPPAPEAAAEPAASARSLVMLSRVAAADAALDAVSD